MAYSANLEGGEGRAQGMRDLLQQLGKHRGSSHRKSVAAMPLEADALERVFGVGGADEGEGPI